MNDKPKPRMRRVTVEEVSAVMRVLSRMGRDKATAARKAMSPERRREIALKGAETKRRKKNDQTTKA